MTIQESLEEKWQEMQDEIEQLKLDVEDSEKYAEKLEKKLAAARAYALEIEEDILHREDMDEDQIDFVKNRIREIARITGK